MTLSNQASDAGISLGFARKIRALKRASAIYAVGDEKGNDPAVKVSRSGYQSGIEQSLSAVVNIPNIASSTAAENSPPDSNIHLVDRLNLIQDNLAVQPHLTPVNYSLPFPYPK